MSTRTIINVRDTSGRTVRLNQDGDPHVVLNGAKVLVASGGLDEVGTAPSAAIDDADPHALTDLRTSLRMVLGLDYNASDEEIVEEAAALRRIADGSPR